MNKRKIVGFSLIVLSMIIAFFNIDITGAVVGGDVLSYLRLVAVGLFVVGVVIMFSSLVETYPETARFYHAYPKGTYTPGRPLDSKRGYRGFHMAESEDEAIDAVLEVNPLATRESLSVVEVDIPREKLGEIMEGTAASSGINPTIPLERYDLFNKMLREGEINIQPSEENLRRLRDGLDRSVR